MSIFEIPVVMRSTSAPEVLAAILTKEEGVGGMWLSYRGGSMVSGWGAGGTVGWMRDEEVGMECDVFEADINEKSIHLHLKRIFYLYKFIL